MMRLANWFLRLALLAALAALASSCAGLPEGPRPLSAAEVAAAADFAIRNPPPQPQKEPAP